MNLRDALTEAAARIARRDAEVLAQHLLGRDRAWLMAHPDDPLSEHDAARLRDLVARRAAQEPLQHLTGTQEFFGRPFAVSGDVLIPRPETELLVEAVLEWLADWRKARPAASQPPRILDVGTGSGAIAITLALQLPGARVTAVDLSPAALAMARHNAERLEVQPLTEADDRPADRPAVRFLQSDLLEVFQDQAGLFDVIVSNPPYVPLADAPTLAHEVVAHEPHLALFAGEDGLSIYRRLIPQAHRALAPEGLLAMEFGFGQRDALEQLFSEQIDAAGNPLWATPRFLDDYAGIPRIVRTQRS